MAKAKKGTKRVAPTSDKSSRQTLDCLDNAHKKAKHASSAESETDTVIEDPNSSMEESSPIIPPPDKHRLEIPEYIAEMVKKGTTPKDIDYLLASSYISHTKYPYHVAAKVTEHLEAFIAAQEKTAGPARLSRMLSVSGLMDSMQIGHEIVSPYQPLMKLARRRSSDKENNPPVFAHESEVYESIRALMTFINDNITNPAIPTSRPAPEIVFDDSDNDTDTDNQVYSGENSTKFDDKIIKHYLSKLRKLSYYMGDLPIPKHSQPDMWMNMAVMFPDDTPPSGSDTEDANLRRPNHSHMLSIVEARCSVAEKQDALEHMTAFSRCLFESRPDRKFVWSFAVCDSVVYPCIIFLENVIPSEPMDISTVKGRRRFVSFMVVMAFTSRARLGYDSTVRYIHDAKQWEIDIFDSESNVKHTYRVVKQIIKGDLDQKNLRTFQCTRYQSAESGTSDADDKEYVFLKDIWSFQSYRYCNTHRDEVYLTRAVSEGLKHINELYGTYPKLLSGGYVRPMKATGSEEEIIDLSLTQLLPKRHYVHNRLATTPFASPIQQLGSIDELIVVVADVMAAYMAAAQICGIHHRDISKDNMMFTRRKDGSVKGLLIDFDIAINNPSYWEENSYMIGTTRYMSIRTLEESDIQRTVLDDWESMFYVLCWEATFGLKNDRVKNAQEDMALLQICNWDTVNYKAAAQFKRSHVDSLRNFISLIASHFYQVDGYEHLKTLLVELYQVMFQNKNMSLLGRGALKLTTSDIKTIQSKMRQRLSTQNESYDTYVYDMEYNAISRRADCSDEIASELLKIIQRARVGALERIKLANESD